MASLDSNLAARLEGVFGDVDRVLALADRMLTDYPELGGDRFERTDIEQIIRGFAQMARETVAGTGETRAFFLETAIPAAVANGETPSSIARSSAVFGILLSEEISAELVGDERRDAIAWLAWFFGEYAREAVEAAQAAH